MDGGVADTSIILHKTASASNAERASTAPPPPPNNLFFQLALRLRRHLRRLFTYLECRLPELARSCGAGLFFRLARRMQAAP